MKILIRASYPNYQMVRRYALCGPEVFNCDVDDVSNTLEGNKPGTVIYTLDGETTPREIPPRWYDMYLLLKTRGEQKEHYLRLLLAERDNTATPEQLAELASHRKHFRQEIQVRLRNPEGSWDTSNDPSFEGLSLGNTALTEKIALFEDGELIFGQEP